MVGRLIDWTKRALIRFVWKWPGPKHKRPGYQYLDVFVRAWVHSRPQERVELLGHCFDELPSNRYALMFRAAGGLRRGFELVWTPELQAEATKRFATTECPEPSLDEIVGSIVQLGTTVTIQLSGLVAHTADASVRLAKSIEGATAVPGEGKVICALDALATALAKAHGYAVTASVELPKKEVTKTKTVTKPSGKTKTKTKTRTRPKSTAAKKTTTKSTAKAGAEKKK